jgi:hypothetical protein
MLGWELGFWITAHGDLSPLTKATLSKANHRRQWKEDHEISSPINLIEIATHAVRTGEFRKSERPDEGEGIRSESPHRGSGGACERRHEIAGVSR